ncbi:MAG: methyltransferase domain-containing protein [Desulfatirhabdiaceae bacterium]
MRIDFQPKKFQTLFEQRQYVSLKNQLYNYRLRKAAIRKQFQNIISERILEIGCGISPIMDGKPNVVFFDLAFAAVQILKQNQGGGQYVVADATHLPFKSNVFSHSVCSEVMEHIEADNDLIYEIARVMKPDGFAVLTVPHRMAYFSYDDVFVGHFRRYEIRELTGLLDSAGFSVTGIEKILGPVEKAAMLIATRLYVELSVRKPESHSSPAISHPAALQWLDGLFEFANTVFMAIAWLDARIFPRSLSTVLLLTMVKD